MATTTEIGIGPQIVPPPNGAEPPKRPRGRPRKEHTPPVAENLEADEPQEQITGDTDFWMNLANLSTEEWNKHIAYLYRCGPVIDRKSNGRPANICRYSTAFDREDIMKEHGSGAYRIDLCRIDPVSGKSFRVAQERFSIVNPKFPPNVPPGDWVEDKGNEVWKWGAPALAGQAPAAGYPPGFNMDKVYDRAFEMAEKLNPKKDTAGENALLVKLAELSDPTRIITLLQAIQPKTDSGATDKLFEMMSVQLKETRTELREMRNKETAPPKSLLEQVAELKPMIGEFAQMFGDRGSRAPWWEGPLEKLVESVPDVIQLVKAGQQQPVQNMAVAPPLGLSAAANQPPPAPPPAAATGTPEEQQFQALLQKWRGHINTILPPLIRFFKKNEDERGGLHFRDWYFDGYDETHWLDLRREVGSGGLLFIINNHPPLKSELSPEPQLHLFLKEFFMNVGEEFKEEEQPAETASTEAKA